jgi:hypothetical protein
MGLPIVDRDYSVTEAFESLDDLEQHGDTTISVASVPKHLNVSHFEALNYSLYGGNPNFFLRLLRKPDAK